MFGHPSGSDGLLPFDCEGNAESDLPPDNDRSVPSGGACGVSEAEQAFGCDGRGESSGSLHAGVPLDGVNDGEGSHRGDKSGSGRGGGGEGWAVEEEEEGSLMAAGLPRPFPSPEGDCTLLRQVDDFVLVTTDRSKAEAFVGVMHDRTKTGDWGFSVHEAKVSFVVGRFWNKLQSSRHRI